MAFIEGAVAFVGGAVTFIEGAVIFIDEGAITSIEGAVTSIGKGGSAVGKSFEITRVKVDDIKGVNKHNLRQQLIMYKLKGPSLLIYSLISVFNYSIRSSLWATLYSTYSTDLLFL